MKSYTITDLRKNIYKVVEETAQTHEPVHVYGKNANTVLIGEEDWRPIQETLHLHSIPGMAESIVEGMKTPIEKTADKLDW